MPKKNHENCLAINNKLMTKRNRVLSFLGLVLPSTEMWLLQITVSVGSVKRQPQSNKETV